MYLSCGGRVSYDHVFQGGMGVWHVAFCVGRWAGRVGTGLSIGGGTVGVDTALTPVLAHIMPLTQLFGEDDSSAFPACAVGEMVKTCAVHIRRAFALCARHDGWKGAFAVMVRTDLPTIHWSMTRVPGAFYIDASIVGPAQGECKDGAQTVVPRTVIFGFAALAETGPASLVYTTLHM
jgi:hypothetical protein